MCSSGLFREWMEHGFSITDECGVFQLEGWIESLGFLPQFLNLFRHISYGRCGYIATDGTYTIYMFRSADTQDLILLGDRDGIESIAYILAYSTLRPCETDRSQAHLFGFLHQR